jgi:hypothetical protein
LSWAWQNTPASPAPGGLRQKELSRSVWASYIVIPSLIKPKEKGKKFLNLQNRIYVENIHVLK